MKKVKLALFALLLGASSWCFASVKKICVIQTAAHAALDKTYEGIIAEIASRGMDIKFANAQGDVNLSNQIAEKCVSDNPDAIVTIGTSATQSAAKSAKKSNIPLVFSSVTDPVAAGLTKKGSNITGVSNFIALEEQLETFKNILPNLQKLGVVYNPGEINSIRILELLEKISIKYGIKIIPSPANRTSEISSATNKLVGKVDAIFISNDNTALAAFGVIAKITSAEKIPLFTSDTDLVSNGAIASLGPNQFDLGKQTGELLLKVLDDKSAAHLPIEHPNKIELAVNKDMAENLNISFSKDILEKAK